MPCTTSFKQRFRLTALLQSTCLVAALTYGCSDSASDDENLEATDNGSQGDLGGDDAKEGNGQENYVDSGDGKGDTGGAEANSATGEGGNPTAGGGSGNLLGEAGAGDAPPANAAPADAPPLNAPAANAAAAPANAAPLNAPAPGGALASAPPAAEPPPAAAAPAPAAAAPAPTAGGGAAPASGGRVRYVKEGGIQAVSAPNGSPVAMLEQGEHPITWEENGWLRITTGMYVPADGLSNTGVPRPQTGGGWTH